jgi:hypothetical protein
MVVVADSSFVAVDKFSWWESVRLIRTSSSAIIGSQSILLRLKILF